MQFRQGMTAALLAAAVAAFAAPAWGQGYHIGAVLPEFRFGDSTIGTSGFGSSQQKIIGGYGIAISGDFAAPVLERKVL